MLAWSSIDDDPQNWAESVGERVDSEGREWLTRAAQPAICRAFCHAYGAAEAPEPVGVRVRDASGAGLRLRRVRVSEALLWPLRLLLLLLQLQLLLAALGLRVRLDILVRA